MCRCLAAAEADPRLTPWAALLRAYRGCAVADWVGGGLPRPAREGRGEINPQMRSGPSQSAVCAHVKARRAERLWPRAQALGNRPSPGLPASLSPLGMQPTADAVGHIVMPLPGLRQPALEGRAGLCYSSLQECAPTGIFRGGGGGTSNDLTAHD